MCLCVHTQECVRVSVCVCECVCVRACVCVCVCGGSKHGGSKHKANWVGWNLVR